MSRIGAELKPPWRQVPVAVRRQVERMVGAPIVRAMRVWGGYAPSPTFRLFLQDGRRVFFKGVDPTSNDHMHRALHAEERVYRDLGNWIGQWAPAFHGSFREAAWHVLLLEDVGGPTAPPWTRPLVEQVMTGYAAFHQHTLGGALPEWLSRQRHHGFARMWTALGQEQGGLEGMAGLAGPCAAEALAWTRAAFEPLRETAESLENVEPPFALLHLDTRSDNLRVQPDGQLRLFDWPYACVGPLELDVASFAQSIACEGGPHQDAVLAAYAKHLPLREQATDAAIVAMAGYFADRAWRPELPELPRVRSFQRRQLVTTLTWAASRLHLPRPEWLGLVRP